MKICIFFLQVYDFSNQCVKHMLHAIYHIHQYRSICMYNNNAVQTTTLTLMCIYIYMLHMAYILVASPVRRSPRDSSLFSSWRLKLGMGKDLLQLCQDLKGCRAADAGSMNLAVSCIIDVMGSVIICNIWEIWSFIAHYEHNVPICSTTQWRAGLKFAQRQER